MLLKIAAVEVEVDSARSKHPRASDSQDYLRAGSIASESRLLRFGKRPECCCCSTLLSTLESCWYVLVRSTSHFVRLDPRARVVSISRRLEPKQQNNVIVGRNSKSCHTIILHSVSSRQYALDELHTLDVATLVHLQVPSQSYEFSSTCCSTA